MILAPDWGKVIEFSSPGDIGFPNADAVSQWLILEKNEKRCASIR